MGPFLFQNRDEDQVQFVKQGPVNLSSVLVVRKRDDKIDDEVTDACERQLVSGELVRRSEGSP